LIIKKTLIKPLFDFTIVKGKPDDPSGASVTHAAYGIWFNSGIGYTIAGGVGSATVLPDRRVSHILCK
jgi:hypothetical protein